MKKFAFCMLFASLAAPTFNPAMAYQWHSITVYTLVKGCAVSPPVASKRLSENNSTLYCGCMADEFQKAMSEEELGSLQSRLLNKDAAARKKIEDMRDSFDPKCMSGINQ